MTLPRVGVGYDSHRFAAGGPMRLGGIDLPSEVHCAGHSDGDAICHAVTDAILGAAALGDIGEMFPDTDVANRGKDSVVMLQAAHTRLVAAGYAVTNVDVTVVTQQPKIGPYRQAIRQRLADTLAVDIDQVFVKGKTNEGMGWIGKGEGLAVIAVATVSRAV
ncbi:MAG: 2-C-methyl-D-erythritol 2,4-cyclodiphosphate synthase [Gemmatimonas sp.]|jgi:2-C-methyl-D-erythritol 2,4-cyclodiphosphate synthase|uniref:2-C-methyl-D-erythritol 2,4-cyclodiphosphate synthase n=1 Tax=Gemmatimonas sp. TaxID=1962908 RepID=UPI00391F5FEF